MVYFTSARVILHKKLIQGHPATANPHHHCAAQDAHQSQLLGVAELGGGRVTGESRQDELSGTMTVQEPVVQLEKTRLLKQSVTCTNLNRFQIPVYSKRILNY